VTSPPENESLLEAHGRPYRIGKKIRLTGTSGQEYLVRIEHQTDHDPSGSCSLVAAVIRPRKYRGSLITMNFPCEDAARGTMRSRSSER
jgi:hypothetical protein